MGSKFEVDTEEVRKLCAKLEEQISQTREHSKEARPVTADGRGSMKNALEETCDDLQDMWKALLLLMENTLAFTKKAAGLYDEADTEQAGILGKK